MQCLARPPQDFFALKISVWHFDALAHRAEDSWYCTSNRILLIQNKIILIRKLRKFPLVNEHVQTIFNFDSYWATKIILF